MSTESHKFISSVALNAEGRPFLFCSKCAKFSDQIISDICGKGIANYNSLRNNICYLYMKTMNHLVLEYYFG